MLNPMGRNEMSDSTIQPENFSGSVGTAGHFITQLHRQNSLDFVATAVRPSLAPNRPLLGCRGGVVERLRRWLSLIILTLGFGTYSLVATAGAKKGLTVPSRTEARYAHLSLSEIRARYRGWTGDIVVVCRNPMPIIVTAVPGSCLPQAKHLLHTIIILYEHSSQPGGVVVQSPWGAANAVASILRGAVTRSYII